MRIDRLDLTAFGPFTQMTLDLSAPGIHLVTGPNEAGKSTALHALDRLLFGIETQSPHDFVHTKSALRLGALLRNPDGGSLEIIRTKSRKVPLLASDGSPLDPTILRSFLGGIERTTFTSVFALTSAELRKGGKTLVRGEGDFGQALAASRSGHRLPEILRAINERTEELYKHRGSKPLINARLAELKQARDRKRDASLRPREYDERERAVTAAEESRIRLAAELKLARSERSRLERLSQALPALNRRGELLAGIEKLHTEGALASEEAVRRLPLLLEELRAADNSLADTQRHLDETTHELNTLIVDDDLLACVDTIERLFQDRKAALDATRRLAKSTGVAAELRTEAGSLLRQVHPGASLTDTARYKVPKTVRTRAGELHDQHALADAALRRSRRAMETRRRKLEEANKKLSELPPAEDTGPLRAVIAAIPQDLLSRMAGADEEERRIQGDVKQILRDLRLATLPIQEAVSIAVPARAQVDAYAGTHSDLKHDRRDLVKRTKDLDRQLAANRLNLAALLNNDPPPTEDDLIVARSARDTLWREIHGGRPAGAKDFERALSHADLIADQMRRDANRVAERYRLELQISDDERKLAKLGEEQSDIDRRTKELDVKWIRLWEDFAGPRPTLGAASATMENVRRLREALGELGAVQAKLASLTQQASQHISRLRDVLRDPEGVASLGAGSALAELPELREVTEARLALHDEAALKRSTMEERVAIARTELAEAEAQVIDHENDLAAWTAGWQKLLARIDLPLDRDVTETLADLDRLEQVASMAAEAVKSERESRQATAVVEQFHALLRTAAAACGRQVPDDETERHQLVGVLYTEAKTNRSRFDRRTDLQASHSKLLMAAGGFQETSARITAELAELVQKSAVDDVAALGEAVRRRERHTRLVTALAEVTATIPAGGEALDSLMAEATVADRDQLQANLAELTDRVTDLDQRRSEQSELSGGKKIELAQLDGSAAAAQAAADTEIAAAALVEESEEYLRLQIARSIVLQCMEDYRQSQRDPILIRASHLFTRLTLDRFNGLELDQEDDAPTVLARRGAELLSVDQLSEGTADQLYLALRLASLEHHADEGRALPFTVDDIFITFDDQRTAAALKVLDEMADRFQMIVFTHHQHLADLARRVLPAGRLHIHPLPEFTPGSNAAAQATFPCQNPERVCRTCQEVLTYSGRGRPPVECAGCSRTRR